MVMILKGCFVERKRWMPIYTVKGEIPLVYHGMKPSISIKIENLVDQDAKFYDPERRTFDSVVKDLRRGDTWIQSQVRESRNGMFPEYDIPFLACHEGFQNISKKLLIRIFNEVPLIRKDYVSGVIVDGKIEGMKVKKWVWRYEEDML